MQDCLGVIFSTYLSHAEVATSTSLVCRSWRYAALPTVWRSVHSLADNWDTLLKPTLTLPPPRRRPTTSNPGPDYSNTQLATLVRCFTLLSTRTTPMVDSRPTHLRRFLGRALNLSSLVLHAPAVNDDDLWVIAAACRSLHTLALVSANMYGAVF